jgi:predicted PurR-regulated permease PerM
MQIPQSTSPDWTPRMKRTVTLLALGLLVLAVWWLSQILPIVIVAVILAYLLNPVVDFIADYLLGTGPLRRVQNRGWAVVFTFILIVALFVIVILVIVPALVGQLEEFGRSIPNLVEAVVKELERLLSQPITFAGEPITLGGKPLIPLEQLAEATGTRDISQILHLENLDLVGATQTFLGSLGGITGPAFNLLGDAVNTLINFSFLLVMMFYLLKDGQYFVKSIVDITPPTYRSDMRRLLHELAQIWNAYLRGQIVISVITGVIVSIAAIILGVPSPLILGLFSGLLQLIPNIGPFLAVLPAAFLALVSQSLTFPVLEGGAFALVVIVVWIAIQNFILFVLVPRMMGHNLDLHPFVVIVAVIGGASVAGALGVILSVPFVASARLLGIYVYGKLTDQESFPPPRPERVPQPALWRRWGARLNRRLPARIREGISVNIDQPLNNLLVKIRRSGKHD